MFYWLKKKSLTAQEASKYVQQIYQKEKAGIDEWTEGAQVKFIVAKCKKAEILAAEELLELLANRMVRFNY